jgi:hypothetical protein
MALHSFKIYLHFSTSSTFVTKLVAGVYLVMTRLVQSLADVSLSHLVSPSLGIGAETYCQLRSAWNVKKGGPPF